MKYTVNNALQSLASEIFSAQLEQSINLEKTLWRRVDRIERRFRCVGLTESKVSALIARRNSFLAAESKRHDQQIPDRRTYLHR
jgi:hypothetical protein